MGSPLLSDVLVVAFEQAVAAPYCTSRLAQDGARVVKVERPEGDFARGYDGFVNGEASYFVWLNAGKESIVLDLKGGDDLEVARALVTAADVVVENLAPGTLGRLGLDLGAERERRPELITCGISGYGAEGPYAGMKAYDLLVQAESGLCAVTGSPESPARVGISLCDIATGMQAYAAILKALLRREQHGKGTGIEVSLFGSIAEWMAVPLMQTRYSGAAPSRIGLAHPSIVPYGVFPTLDGVDLLISIQNEREWKALAQALLPKTAASDPRFASNIGRVRNRKELDTALTVAFGHRTSREVTVCLEENGIAFARLRAPDEVIDHPALKWMKVDTVEGGAEVPRPGTGLPERQSLRVPALNEDGARIREEFARCN